MKEFANVAELRRDQLEKLAAGFRLFAFLVLMKVLQVI